MIYGRLEYERLANVVFLRALPHSEFAQLAEQAELVVTGLYRAPDCGDLGRPKDTRSQVRG